MRIGAVRQFADAPRDVAFVRNERIPKSRMPSGYFHEAPDLAVEVVSPRNTI